MFEEIPRSFDLLKKSFLIGQLCLAADDAIKTAISLNFEME